MTQIDASKYTKIPLGRQGENLARQIVFDLSDFLSVYGDGVAELIHQRSGDTVPYPVPAVRAGSTLVWTVSNVDTDAQASCLYGQCELRWYVGDVLVKSRIWRTLVEPAMDTPSETVPPAPEHGWVEQVVAAGAAAAAAAGKAEDALSKAPRIGDNGNWMVWDAAQGDYTDTGLYAGGIIPYIGSNGHWYIGTEDSGVPATGPAGKDGKDGAPGADGHTPEYGVDYGTPEQIAGIANQAAEVLRPGLNQIKDDLSAEQTAREQSDTSLQQEVSGKLPKSPANWEAWTAEEQVAAREMMNAQESYRHIATITIDADEVYNVGIDRDENGEVFALSDVYIYGYIKKTGSNGQIAVAINTIYTGINSGNNIIKLPSNYKISGAQFELNIKKSKYWRAYAVSSIGVNDPNISSTTGATSVSHRGASNVRNNEWETLTALAFVTSDAAFGIGTTFDIWGR